MDGGVLGDREQFRRDHVAGHGAEALLGERAWVLPGFFAGMAAALRRLLDKAGWAGGKGAGKPAVIRPPCAAGRLRRSGRSCAFCMPGQRASAAFCGWVHSAAVWLKVVAAVNVGSTHQRQPLARVAGADPLSPNLAVYPSAMAGTLLDG